MPTARRRSAGEAGFIEAERVGRGIGAEAADLYDRLEAELT